MLCLPVQEQTLKKTLQKVQIASKKADLVEIWLDQIEDLQGKKPKSSQKMLKKTQKQLKIKHKNDQKILRSNLTKLLKSCPKPLLAVCKQQQEKGNWNGPEETRVEILKNAAFCGFRYLDIGIETSEKLIKDLLKNKKKSKIIISWHNFQRTPDLLELEKIYLKAQNLGADIVKIATRISSVADNLTILNLLYSRNCSSAAPAKNAGKARPLPLIAIGMGPKGKITRIFGPQLGAPITYLSLSEKAATAPGQLTIKQYRQIQKILF